MPASDVLQQMRTGQPMSEPGLQQPAVDPIMVLAGLLGPMLAGGAKGFPSLIQGLMKSSPQNLTPDAQLLNNPWLSYLVNKNPMAPMSKG